MSSCSVASLVSLVVVAAYRPSLSHESQADPISVDYMWRILIGLGCVPAAFGLYFRLTVPETPRFTIDIKRNLDRALADISTSLMREDFHYDDEITRRITVPRASWGDFSTYFSKWDNFKPLFGAAYSWFAIDVSFYGLGLNSPTLLENVVFGTPTGGKLGIYDKLHNISAVNIILAIGGLIPGYWVSFAFIDSWGRKPIQLMGFSVLAVLFLIMGLWLRMTSGLWLTGRCRFRLWQPHWEPCWSENLHIPILPCKLFSELRAKYHHLYYPRGNIPYSLPLNLPWHRSCEWEAWWHSFLSPFFQIESERYFFLPYVSQRTVFECPL
jgi:hypothetical protein